MYTCYSYYLCAIRWHCCALSDLRVIGIVPIVRMKFSPEGEKIGPEWGGIYESDSPMLRGDWLCGGPLVF